MVKNTYLLNWHNIVGAHWNCLRQCQRAPTTYVTEIKETYFEINIYQDSCPLALPLSNISICQSVLKCLTLYGKFDFTNYAFAKLVLAWLYKNPVLCKWATRRSASSQIDVCTSNVLMYIY